MGGKPTQSGRDASRERNGRRHEHDPRRPWLNTRPRANQELDRRDFERSVERFEALLGR
jgi:hypothetical protein